ncbi:MAG: Obg family GTPase CgtA [Candidatus Omnitrophica bacterium]|nr:Obg family GTPase CgtA [Candidatus Omnitrophota bacterium]
MFVDRARISVKAGRGGDGCESYYFSRGMRYRRRDGGDGGKGGDVLIRASHNVHTLLDFRYRQHFSAKSGKHGSSNQKKGRDGEDCLILVPVGTIILDIETGYKIRDLDKVDEQVLVAKGGIGGRGNLKGRIATSGEPGQEKNLSFELKIIADVGLIGYPNAGKSSFLNIISQANSKVAHFPFTTLSPVLGVVTSSTNLQSRFVVADIPGLIKDAHKGKGLGIEFLRHIERTKLLLFVIDIAAVDGRDAVSDYFDLVNEIQQYNPLLLKKPQIIIVNKIDLPEAQDNLDIFKKAVKKTVYKISCVTKEGADKVVNVLFRKLKIEK